MSPKQPKIRFTRHAKDKFKLLKEYGFDLAEAKVTEAVTSPSRVDRRGGQLLALKLFDQEYAIRVDTS